MRSRPRFFERFRREVSRVAPFVHVLGDPVPAAALLDAEHRLGRPLPAPYAELLRSWNGVVLFHEALAVHGVGPGAVGGDVVGATQALAAEEGLASGDLVVADLGGGDHAIIDRDGAVDRFETGSGERVRVASDFEAFLDATVAREGAVYDRDGEFREGVLDEEGELDPAIALRIEERIARLDRSAAYPCFEAARALRRLGRHVDAERRLEEAVRRDPGFPWAWFDLGRSRLDEDPEGAEEAFVSAARILERRDPAGAGRFLAWACRAAVARGDEGRAQACRAAATALDAEVGRSHRDAAAAALEEGRAGEALLLARVAHAVAPRDVAALDLVRRAERAASRVSETTPGPAARPRPEKARRKTRATPRRPR